MFQTVELVLRKGEQYTKRCEAVGSITVLCDLQS